LSGEEETLEVYVKYKDMELKFKGSPNEVIRSFLKFIQHVLPAYDLASRLVLKVELEDLLKGVEGIIAYTSEGLVVTVPKDKIGGERDAILLQLVKAYIGYMTGRTEKDTLATSEIVSLTGGKSRSVGARLSELTSSGWVERVGRGEYRITTLGLKGFMDEVLPKIGGGERV